MIIYVPLEVIKDNPFQARTEYGDIGELAEDIKRHRPTRPDTYGLQQVPGGRVLMNGLVLDETEVVRLLGPEKRLRLQAGRGVVELEFGHRRYRAFCHLHDQGAAGFEDGYMPVFIRKLSDAMMLDGVWSENRARRDLSAVEEAELLARKLATCASQREVADAWGLDRSTVANRLRLLKLPAEVQQAIRQGQVSERQALALLPLYELPEPALRLADESDTWYVQAPAQLLAEAIGGASSDALRQRVYRTVENITRDLEEATWPLDQEWPLDPNASQAEQVRGRCTGCPLITNGRCGDPGCYETKTRHWRNHRLAAAGVKTGLQPAGEEDHERSWRLEHFRYGDNHTAGAEIIEAGCTGGSKLFLRLLHAPGRESESGHQVPDMPDCRIVCVRGGGCLCLRQRLAGQSEQTRREAAKQRYKEHVVTPVVKQLAGRLQDIPAEARPVLRLIFERKLDAIYPAEALEKLLTGLTYWDWEAGISAWRADFTHTLRGVGIEVDWPPAPADETEIAAFQRRLERVATWVRLHADTAQEVRLRGNLENLDKLQAEAQSYAGNGLAEQMTEHLEQIATLRQQVEARLQPQEA